MKRAIIFLSAALLIAAASLASPAQSYAQPDNYWGTIDFGIGYRVDQLDWNIAGNTSGTSPNVLSELTWDDLQILQIETGFRASAKRVYLRGSLAYGWILSGDNQDSDYLGNNRTLEFSRSNNSSDDGDVMDATIGIGYLVLNGNFKLAPLAGYSYHDQDVKINDGVQTVATAAITPPVGPFPGLDSSYEAQWDGPWIGLDMSNKFSDRFSLLGSFEYHWADYKGKGNWNLRSDFMHPVSFSHDADGDGIVAAVEAVVTPARFWPIHVEVKYQNWSTDNGTDTTHFVNGATGVTRLNEVNWESLAIMIKTSYYFH